MNEPIPATSEWEQQHAKNVLHLRLCITGWVAFSALAQFGPRFIWDYHIGLTITGVLIYLATGFWMVLANGRHLRGLDEMQQKIFLEAAALTLGVGLVCGLGYEMLDDIRLVTFQPEISHLIILMCLTFGGGMAAGRRKYR